MMIAAGILLTAIAILLFFGVGEHRRLTNQISVVRREKGAELNEQFDHAKGVDRKLVDDLVGGRSTREAIQKWQRSREALLPGCGWKWGRKDLESGHKKELRNRLDEVRNAAVFRVVRGIVAIALTTAAAGLVWYWQFSQYGSLSGATAPAVQPWTGGENGGTSGYQPNRQDKAASNL